MTISLETMLTQLETLLETDKRTPWEKGFVRDQLAHTDRGRHQGGMRGPVYYTIENLHWKHFEVR